MSKRIFSLTLRGLDAEIVRIEVDHYNSHPGVVIVGLGDRAVQESKERVRSALKNSGFSFPRGKVVVNLAPAELPKSGPVFDLPIAIGIIALNKSFSFENFSSSLFLGELALDGTLRSVRGVLPMVNAAKKCGFSSVFLPEPDAHEASYINGIKIFPVRSLSHLCEHFSGNEDIIPISSTHPVLSSSSKIDIDFSNIRGQPQAKRALEIAAAGGHNILFNGSPGSGKTLMAKALRGILPTLSFQESLEVTQIYSLSGLLPKDTPLITSRPFRSVHHTASAAAIVGGGRIPLPGEISLAHRGVLFFDEIAEFPAHVLDSLRQPLEDRYITISRTHGSLTYPSHVLFCAAMNPCPCGYHNVPGSSVICECAPSSLQRYQKRLSGPLIDRFDLYCVVSPLSFSDLNSSKLSEDSFHIRERVQKARDIQIDRFSGSSLTCNSEMRGFDDNESLHLSSAIKSLLEKAVNSLSLSARAYFKVIKVARTIADLSFSEFISSDHILEAIHYRSSFSKNFSSL